MDCESTIKRAVSVKGIGLHTGKSSEVKFLPADPGSGVRFVRVDLDGKPEIQGCISSVIEVPRRTTLGREGVRVHTVEHILAAVAGLGIDNLVVEVDGEEVPEVDGSPLPFVRLLKEAGTQKQEGPRRFFAPPRPVVVRDKDAWLAVFPGEEFRIALTISYKNPTIGSQYGSFVIAPDTFEAEIAGARTFVPQEEADALRKEGLGKGATFSNTLVAGQDGVVEGKLRYSDEFVRHKIGDLVGDLSLLGRPIKGTIVGARSGHALNIELVRELAKELESGMGPEPGDVLLDANAIKAILPHRYPFLFVDVILEIEADKRIVAIKNVTMNEEFFVGHFPGRPVMPGVLIVEAMAQAAGVLMLRKPENLGKLAYVMSIDKVKLRKPVVPGDQMRLEVDVLKLRRRAGKVQTRAIVRGQLVAEAELMFSLVEPGDSSS